MFLFLPKKENKAFFCKLLDQSSLKLILVCCLHIYMYCRKCVFVWVSLAEESIVATEYLGCYICTCCSASENNLIYTMMNNAVGDTKNVWLGMDRCGKQNVFTYHCSLATQTSSEQTTGILICRLLQLGAPSHQPLLKICRPHQLTPQITLNPSIQQSKSNLWLLFLPGILTPSFFTPSSSS